MIPRRRVHMESGELSFVAQLLETGAPPEYAIDRLEAEMAARTGVPYAAAVNSGRRAMTLILKHLKIGPGDEVIIPAYTLKDLIPLIQGLGARVVPADIDPETFNLDPQAVETRLSSSTKAILALHIFGASCEIRTLARIAKRHGCALIEDCAHSLGATVGGRQTGSFGHAGFFSFETTKPVNTFGGGMVVTRDKTLVKAIHQATRPDVESLRSFRQKTTSILIEEFMFATGLGFPLLYLLATPGFKQSISRLYRRFQHAPPANIRYLPIQAELGLRKLESLNARILERHEAALRLRALLNPAIQVQKILEGTTSSWYFFVALLPTEAAPIRKKLLFKGIDAGIEDEIADNCAGVLGFDDCPNVKQVFSRAIALPMYEGITERTLRKVADSLNALV